MRFFTSFNASKASTTTSMPSPTISTMSKFPLKFRPLDAQPGLVSVGEAQLNPEIKYRAVDILLKPKPAPEVSQEVVEQYPPFEEHILSLVPLHVAAKCKTITHRAEGYEMSKPHPLEIKMVYAQTVNGKHLFSKEPVGGRIIAERLQQNIPKDVVAIEEGYGQVIRKRVTV